MRRFFKCSPKVVGSNTQGRGFNDFNDLGPNGKKATRV
jgi:hypothetical protein